MNTRAIALMAGLVYGSALSVFWYAEPEQQTPTAALASYCKDIAMPTIQGRAAYAVDVTTGAVLYEKNSSAQLPLASLTKVMTVLVALKALTPEAVVTISSDALSPEGDSGLKKNEAWHAGDLASFTLIESSNDGARALMLRAAEAMSLSADGFVERMNQRARSLGLQQTFFLNETGLDVSSSTAGAYGSAHDIALLLAYVAGEEPALVERSVEPSWSVASMGGVSHTATNTSLLAASFASSVASKTGYTDLAGGNLAFMYEPIPARPVAVVVLGSTKEGRNTDARIIAEYAQETLRRGIECRTL